MILINEQILALSLSRNRLAFAIFRYGELDFYGGRTLRQYQAVGDRNKAFSAMLMALILAHSIGELVLPRLNKQQRLSRDLLSLYRTAGRFCVKNHVSLQIQDPVQARRRLVDNARPSKANASLSLSQIFPELTRYARGGDWERRYYGHLFTAITCGLSAARAGSAPDRKGGTDES